MCPITKRNADIEAGKTGRKKLQKKRKKVLTKWLWGGKIAKRLSEGRPEKLRQEPEQRLEPQGKAQVTQERPDTKIQRNLKKGVDKGQRTVVL